MKNKKQLPLLHNSNLLLNNQNPLLKKRTSQSSVQENSSVKQSFTSTNLQLNLNKMRNTRYQDPMSVQEKIAVPTKLSSLAEDPQLHEYLQQRQNTNFYGQMFRNSQSMTSYKTNFSDLDSKAGTIEISPLLQNVKSHQLQTYLKKIIQQQSQSIQLSTTLPSRQLAIDLTDWFNNMMKQVKYQIKSSKIDIQGAAEEISLLYSTCLQELIRQISLECKERGTLLQKVWDSYVLLIDELVQNIAKQSNQQQEQCQKLIESSINNSVTQTNSEEIIILNQQIKELENIKSEIEKKNQNLVNKINKQQEEIKLLYQTVEQLHTENQKLQNQSQQISNQQSQTNIPQLHHKTSIQEGKSIVSHLMTKKANISQLLKHQSISPIQIVKTEEELSKTPLSQFQLDDQLDSSQIVKVKKYKNKKRESLPNIIIDQKFVQTERQCYSQIPILNEFIHSLINNGLSAIYNEVSEDEYRESINIVKCATSISIQDEEYVIETLNKSKLKTKTLEQLEKYLLEINNKYNEFQKKSVEQMLEIKEHKVAAQSLEQNLKEVTQDFVQILYEKQQTIKQLQHGQTLLFKKLNSFNQDQMSNLSSKRSPQFKMSPSKKTPNFSNTFDFNKEQIAKEFDVIKVEEDSNSQKSQENLPSERTFKIQSQLHLNIVEQDEELREIIQGETKPTDLTEQEQQIMDTSVMVENQNEDLSKSDNSKSQQLDLQFDSQMDAQRLSNVKKLVQKFGFQRQSTRRYTKPLAIKLSLLTETKQEKKKVKRVFSQNTDSANGLLKDIMQKTPTKNKQKVPIIPFIQISKIFYTIILDATKNIDGYKIPLHVSIYDYFMKKYGFKNVAEKKIKQIFQFINSKKTSQPKMQLIARLCYMDGDMDEAIYKQFVESVKYFSEKEVNFHKQEAIISIDQMIEFCNEHLIKLLGQNLVNLFIQQIKSQSSINFELEMINIINLYFSKKRKFEDTLQLIFQAADLDGNQLIEFSEFKTLYKAIHPDLYDKAVVLEQFISFADYIDESTKDKMITLERFAEMALELNLFTKEHINTYSQGCEQLFDEWKEKKNLIKYRFLTSNNYHKVKYTYNLLTESIQQHIEKKNCPHTIQILWISFRLLLERSERVILNHEFKDLFTNLLPQEVLQIGQTYNAIAEINL